MSICTFLKFWVNLTKKRMTIPINKSQTVFLSEVKKPHAHNHNKPIGDLTFMLASTITNQMGNLTNFKKQKQGKNPKKTKY